MKTSKVPNYIYTYWSSKNDRCSVYKHEIRVYRPYCTEYSKDKSGRLGDELFSIEGQSNMPDKPDFTGVVHKHGIGLRRAYGFRVNSLELGKSDAFKLAVKLCSDVSNDGGFPTIVKRLKKLGAVRFALGNVQDAKSYNGREFMPRKYASKRLSVAYWNAIKAGLELPL
jgi:hypothetical protein